MHISRIPCWVCTFPLPKSLVTDFTLSLKLFTKLGLTVIATMLMLFYPFLPSISSLKEEGIFAQSIRQPIIRIFPFGRGLFEDKVANFWCASSVVIKWRTWMQDTSLIRMSTVLTALGFAPGVAIMLYIAFSMRQKGGQVVVDTKTTALLPLLPYTLLNSSLSFFLFSFQVHEKTILVPLLPMTLLFSGSLSGDVEEIFGLGALMVNAAVFRFVTITILAIFGLMSLATACGLYSKGMAWACHTVPC